MSGSPARLQVSPCSGYAVTICVILVNRQTHSFSPAWKFYHIFSLESHIGGLTQCGSVHKPGLGFKFMSSHVI